MTRDALAAPLDEVRGENYVIRHPDTDSWESPDGALYRDEAHAIEGMRKLEEQKKLLAGV